jgi:putative mycofactocin binding protein MftB
MACAASTENAPEQGSSCAFELGSSWRLHPQVAVRPEQFGALAYHYGTRRLSSLKSRTLLEVVQRLDGSPSALDACHASGVSEEELPLYTRALQKLAQTGMIIPGGAR